MTTPVFPDNISINTHSSIRVAGSKVFYFDPFQVTEETHDADAVFVTHSHFDHFEPESIGKVRKEGTVFVMPASMREEAEVLKDLPGIHAIRFLHPGEGPSYDISALGETASFPDRAGESCGCPPDTAEVLLLRPGEEALLSGLCIRAVPAYNLPPKRFHPSGNAWLGYLVTDGDVRYYVAGDTDDLPELSRISCDVALVPAGGKYTMTAEEAADLVNRIRPVYAIPMHYGTVAGQKDDGARFKALVEAPVKVRLLL